tara:strand:- start:195 stop:776 length:582 start_codon:yes stop_codon:yes gene_type:complete
MKKKTLLNENTIRRFMRLADMEALQENYFGQYGIEEQEEEEAEVELGAEEPAGELDMGGEEELDMGGEEELEMGGEGGDVDEAAIKDLVDTIATAIEDKYNIPMSVEGGGEEPAGELDMGGEEELDMGGEEEMEMGGEEPAGELEMGGEEEELMEAFEEANINVIDDDALVQEVLRRVTKRLIRQSMKSGSNK